MVINEGGKLKEIDSFEYVFENIGIDKIMFILNREKNDDEKLAILRKCILKRFTEEACMKIIKYHDKYRYAYYNCISQILNEDKTISLDISINGEKLMEKLMRKNIKKK